MFNRKVLIRQAMLDDVNEIFDVEKKVWGKEAATKEMIISRINVFPEGNSVAVKDNKIIGVVFAELIDGDKEYKTWYDYTDSGLIKRTHRDDGKTLFGVGLSVVKDHGNGGVGTSLLLAVGELAIMKGVKNGILGGRIPDYSKHKDIPVEEYVKLRDGKGKAIDPEIRFYERAGLSVKNVIPNYFEDPDSGDYGVLLDWKNPFYFLKGRLTRKIGVKIFRVLFKLETGMF